MDNATAEVLGIALRRYVVERLRDLGVQLPKQAYHAQAVAALAEMPQNGSHTLWRALQWFVDEAARVH